MDDTDSCPFPALLPYNIFPENILNSETTSATESTSVTQADATVLTPAPETALESEIESVTQTTHTEPLAKSDSALEVSETSNILTTSHSEPAVHSHQIGYQSTQCPLSKIALSPERDAAAVFGLLPC